VASAAGERQPDKGGLDFPSLIVTTDGSSPLVPTQAYSFARHKPDDCGGFPYGGWEIFLVLCHPMCAGKGVLYTDVHAAATFERCNVLISKTAQ
jgi:hypothetical protein